MRTVKCPHCSENIDVNDLPLGNQEFLVRASSRNTETNLESYKYFGPFESRKRAEESLAKVCGGFDEADILERNQKTGEIKSLTQKFLG